MNAPFVVGRIELGEPVSQPVYDALAVAMVGIMRPAPPLQPAQTVARPRHYCYAPQLRSAASLLSEMGFEIIPTIKPVLYDDELRGLPGGVWVEVSNHPQQVPAEMIWTVHRQGFLTLSLSDQFIRDRGRR